jgi:hypothetical protein
LLFLFNLARHILVHGWLESLFFPVVNGQANALPCVHSRFPALGADDMIFDELVTLAIQQRILSGLLGFPGIKASQTFVNTCNSLVQVKPGADTQIIQNGKSLKVGDKAVHMFRKRALSRRKLEILREDLASLGSMLLDNVVRVGEFKRHGLDNVLGRKRDAELKYGTSDEECLFCVEAHAIVHKDLQA